MTRQLLTFAGKQSAQPKILDLNNVLERMLKILHQLLGENIRLYWMPGFDVGNVNMDPSQMDQILANLCLNARDAISETGRITIRTEKTKLTQPLHSVTQDIPPGDYAVLAISDDGCGMEPETLARIFDPFFTTKDAGTGLGLATVFGLVKQNAGFIDVTSEPGQGTTFRIFLPSSFGQQTASEADKDRARLRGTEKVLVVEDEPQVLLMTKSLLEGLGYTVVDALTPNQALEIVEKHDGTFDLLLVDVVLPEMNGRELAAKLQKRFPRMKILFMSGYTSDILAYNLRAQEGVHFLEKPFDTVRLGQKVREALG